MTKLTDKIVATLPVPAQGNQRTADSELPGFCVVVTAAGVRSFALRYRIGARQKLLTLGKYPTWTTTAARQRARELRRLVDQGIDPGAEQAQPDTVRSVLAEFIARDQKPNNRCWYKVERLLSRDLAPLLDRPITSVSKRDVLDMLDGVVDRGATVHANRVHAWVRRLFNWSVGRGILDASPMTGVKAPTREKARDKVLSPDELAAIWRAAGALQSPFPGLVQLLILTAARKSEVSLMRWEHVNVPDRLWTVPREHAKADRAHEVPLSDLAMEIIGEPGEGLVFVGQGGGAVHQFGKCKAKLDKLSGVTGWRIHDLRRTAASGMARLGHPPHVVASVLNHAPASTMGITAIYNRHRYTDEKRAALDAWAREISRMIGRGEARVVHLSRTG